MDTDTNAALPQGWEWKRLGEICHINPRRPALDFSSDTPTTFVPMSAVGEKGKGILLPEIKDFGEVKKGYTYFEEHDVIFAKITPCMQNGKHSITRGLLNGFAFGSTEFHVVRSIDTAIILPEWVHFFLIQPSVLREATLHFTGSVGQQRVPDEYLQNIVIPVPPLAEQKRIAAALTEQMAHVETARRALLAQITAVNELPAALLRSVFDTADDSRIVTLGEVCRQDRKTVAPDSAEAATLPYLGLENIESGTGRLL